MVARLVFTPKTSLTEKICDGTISHITVVTTNMRLWRVFFCLFKPEFRGHQSTVSMVFHALWQRRFPRRWMKNNDSFLNYFIKMKDYIVKTTRSLRAEWNSRNILYSLRNGFQVVYLFDVWKHGSRGRLNCQEAKLV